MRLLTIAVVDGPDQLRARADTLSAVVRPASTAVDVTGVGLASGARGPATGMGRLTREALTVVTGADAERDGYDAVVVDDLVDGAIDPLRSRLAIPVVGAGTATWAIAALLGGDARVAVADADRARAVSDAVHLRHADHRVAAVEPAATDGGSLMEWAIASVEAGHRLLVIGEPSLEGHAQAITQRTGATVLAPGAIAIKVAEALVDLGLSHSTEAYLAPAADLDTVVARRLATRDLGCVTLPASATPRDYRLKVVVPISGMTPEDLARRADALVPGILHPTTRLDYRGVSDSSNSGDCQYDTFLLDLFCAEEELRADAEGYDAVIVDSNTDSGIPAARPHLRSLALGPGESCWSLASVLGERFGIVAMERKWWHFYHKSLRLTRFEDRLASIEYIGVPTDPVNLFAGKEDQMNALLVEAARRGIDLGADAIVIGSTTMHEALPTLAAALPVPVLSPGRIGVRMAELLLDLGLRHPASGARTVDDGLRLFDERTRTEPHVVHA